MENNANSETDVKIIQTVNTKIQKTSKYLTHKYKYANTQKREREENDGEGIELNAPSDIARVRRKNNSYTCRQRVLMTQA